MKTIGDLINEIEKILNSEKFKDCRYPVYRGQSKSSYELLPPLIRDNKPKKDSEIWRIENSLYYEFISLVASKIKINSSWESLYLMRHEEIPTRLLDWTEHLGIALFFALDSEVLDNPHIWILDPYIN